MLEQTLYTIAAVACLAIAVWLGSASMEFFFYRSKDWMGIISCTLLVVTVVVFALLALRELARSGLGWGVAVNVVLPWTLVVLLIKEYFSLGLRFDDFIEKVKERKRRRG
ncbi:MAG: hypothetical protein Q7R93_00430 [bacterium]|nr:hypothetical protein [bacterium]